MNDLEAVCTVFDQVEADSSRKVKEGLLRGLVGHRSEYVAKELFSIALSWDRLFGIRELPMFPSKYDPLSPKSGWDYFLLLVSQLEHDDYREEAMRTKVAEAFATYHPVAQKWLTRCLTKDLRMGVTETTVNKIWPGLIQTFTAMKPYDTDWVDVHWPVYLETKWDGVRCIIVAEMEETGLDVKFFSFAGKELLNLDYIWTEIGVACRYLLVGQGLVFDGEAMMRTRDGAGWETVHKVNGALHKYDLSTEDKKRMRYLMFDLLTLDEWRAQVCSRQLSVRRDALDSVMSEAQLVNGKPFVYVLPSVAIPTSDLDFAQQFFAQHLRDGHEGIMIKRCDGLYRWDRHMDWQRIKGVETGDFLVVDLYESPKEHRAGMLGGLILKMNNGTVSDCGGGFSKEDRIEIWQNRDKYRNVVAEVKYKGLTPDGALREPVFLRWRLDKTA